LEGRIVGTQKVALTEKRIKGLQVRGVRYEVRDGGMPGLCVRVSPTGQKVYIVRYSRGKAVTLGDCGVFTLVQARDMARGVMHQAACGIDPMAGRNGKQAANFETYVEEIYKPWALSNLKRGGEAVALLKAVWAPVFGGKPLSAVTLQAVEKARGQWRMGGLAPATCNRYTGGLSGLLSLAVRYKDLDTHPMKGIRQLPVDNTRIRFLSPQEEQSLRDALDARQAEMAGKRENYNSWLESRKRPLLAQRGAVFTDYLKPLVLLAMNTGLRRGELLSLTWADVDLENGQVIVQPGKSKNGKRRYVDLSDEAYWVLQELQKEAHGTFVFQEGGKPLKIIRNPFEAILERAGIADFRFHDLRHHFASRLVQAGADLNTVRELLGHGDLKMTLRYAHLAPHNRRKAINLLNKPREAGGNVVNFRR
jgi:integrase